MGLIADQMKKMLADMKAKDAELLTLIEKHCDDQSKLIENLKSHLDVAS
mgnify:CR=1 FL=1